MRDGAGPVRRRARRPTGGPGNSENARLREALQNIVYADGDYKLLQANARAALGEGEK